MIGGVFLVLVACIITTVGTNSLLIVGKAERTLPHSYATIKLEIVGTDKDPSNAISKVEVLLENLRKAIKTMVTKEEIKVTQPQISAEINNDGKIAFYETIIEVELIIRNNVGKLIDVADNFGTLIDVSFGITVEERKELKAELVEEAFLEAEEKARTYADRIGLELDGVQLVEIDDDGVPQEDSCSAKVQVSVLFKLYSGDSFEGAEEQQGRIARSQPNEGMTELREIKESLKEMLDENLLIEDQKTRLNQSNNTQSSGEEKENENKVAKRKKDA